MTIKDRRVQYHERRLAHALHTANRTTWCHTCGSCGNHVYVEYKHRETFWCSSCRDYTTHKFDDNDSGMGWHEWLMVAYFVGLVAIAAILLANR